MPARVDLGGTLIVCGIVTTQAGIRYMVGGEGVVTVVFLTTAMLCYNYVCPSEVLIIFDRTCPTDGLYPMPALGNLSTNIVGSAQLFGGNVDAFASAPPAPTEYCRPEALRRGRFALITSDPPLCLATKGIPAFLTRCVCGPDGAPEV